jgi:hypothetical protein
VRYILSGKHLTQQFIVFWKQVYIFVVEYKWKQNEQEHAVCSRPVSGSYMAAEHRIPQPEEYFISPGKGLVWRDSSRKIRLVLSAKQEYRSIHERSFSVSFI